jgi:UDP-glucose 4-epimerase
MRILITGSTGFLGGSFGRFAARSGHEITGIGRSDQTSGDWPGAYAQVNNDVARTAEVIDGFCPDIVFHGAGTASVGASFQDPFLDFQGSVLTCENLFAAVHRSNCRPLIFIPSSAAVYGNADSLPIDESAPLNPISPYGLHKSICETLARGWADEFGLRIVVCRFFSLFGTLQRRLLVWELFQQLSQKSEPVTIEGTGSESRDFLCVDDAANAFLKMSQTLCQAPAGYFEIINLAGGEETTVADLAEHLRKVLGARNEIRYRGLVRPGDPLRWRADISKLISIIPDWRPQSLRDALQLCIDSWQQSAVLHHGA